MGFLDRLKKGVTAFNAASHAAGDTDIALGQLSKGAPVLSTVEQLQFFKDSGSDVDITVMKDGTQTRRMWKVAEIDPLTYGIDLADEFGGGRFQLKYSIAGKDVKRNNGSQVINYLDMASLPGEKRLKSIHQKGEEAKVVVQQNSMTQAIEFYKLMNESKGNAPPPIPAPTLSEVTDTLVKLKGVADDGGGADPLALVDRILDYNTKAIQNAQALNPPITTAPSGGVFGGNMVAQIAKGLGEAGLGVLLGGNGQKAAPGAAPEAAAIPQNVAGQPPTPGTPTATPPGFLQGQSGLFSPLLFLQEKFTEQPDPQMMARYCIQAMDNVATYDPEGTPQVWRQLDQNPAASFDLLTTLLPPHNVPQYVAQVRELVVGYFLQHDEEAFDEPEVEMPPDIPSDIPPEMPPEIIDPVEQFIEEPTNVESSDNSHAIIRPEPEPPTSQQSTRVEPEGPEQHEGPD